MFDPITISASLGIASTAFTNIKRMFQAGRDLEAMSQDLSRWMGAVSDVDNALKQFLMFTHGSKSWDDLLAMEGQIRKRRQKEVYDKQQFREKVIMYVALAVVLVVGTGILGGFVYGLMGFDRGWW
jgi:hypothetical protein